MTERFIYEYDSEGNIIGTEITDNITKEEMLEQLKQLDNIEFTNLEPRPIEFIELHS